MDKHRFKTKKDAYNEVITLIRHIDYSELLANEFAYNKDYEDISERDIEWMAESEQRISLCIEVLLDELTT